MRTLCVLLAVLAAVVTADLGASYSEVRAKELALLSAAAYSSKPEGCLPKGYSNFHRFELPFKSASIAGFACVDDSRKQVILSFRGSVSLTQLIEEATNSRRVPYPAGGANAKALEYFSQASTALRSSVTSALNTLIQGGNRQAHTVIITGHSLGGALAVLTAHDLVKTGFLSRQPVVYTFGEPRVGNGDLAHSIMKVLPDAVRVVHYRDLVSHLPPCNAKSSVCQPTEGTLNWAYHHSMEAWYPQSAMPAMDTAATGTFQTCMGTPLGEDTKCSNSLILKTSIDDHKVYFGKSLGSLCPFSTVSSDWDTLTDSSPEIVALSNALLMARQEQLERSNDSSSSA